MMFKVFCATLLLCFSIALTQEALAQKPNVEIILDLSGSMWLELETGETKIDAAKTALSEIITNLKDDSLNVGLRVYGATVSGIDPNACTDSQQLLDISNLDKDTLIATVNDSNPKGGTPIVYALNEAMKDFQNLPTGEAKAIILVTDGQESCGQDLAAMVQTLKARGIDLQVIGFGLSARASQAFEGLSGFVNTVTTVELTTALEETVLDLNPVETNALNTFDAVVIIQESETTNVETASIETEVTTEVNTEAPVANEFDVNVSITQTNNIINIVDIVGPNQLRYNAAPTTYDLHWDGNPTFPLTVVLEDVECTFSGQNGGCIFQSNPIVNVLNPIPLGITCSSRATNSRNSGSWINEIKLVDNNGIESDSFVLDISCVP